MAIEHAEHAVDLGRDLLAERRHARHVLLEDHRRRELAARVAHALEEPFGVDEQLLGRQRDLLPAHDVLVVELEPRLGPQQELVERGLAVDQTDLGGGDLAVEEPDLAAPEAANQRQDGAAPEGGQGADQGEHARGLGERPHDVVALPGGLALEEAADGDDIPEKRREQDDLVGAGGLGVGAADPAAGEDDRDVELLLVEGEPGLAEEVEGAPVGAADDDQGGALGGDVEASHVRGRERGRHAFPREPELDLAARPRIGVEHDDFRGSRHAAVAT